MPLSLALAVVLLPQAPDASPDWPQYRGPAHDNTSSETEWSSQGAESPVWRAAIGQGYASPVVSAGRLVTSGHFADPGVDRLVCLDAATGEELWRHEVAATDAPQFHEGGTLSTPTIRGARVYRIDRRGVLRVHALADGGLLWSRDYAAELGLAKTFHGFSASPLFVGDRLVLQLCGTLLAADPDNGDVLWHTDDPGDRSYSNPEVVEGSGRTAIAAVRHMTLTVHALDDGKLLHEYPWQLTGNAVHCATPLVFDDRVFVSTAYNKGCAMLRLGDGNEPELLWAHRRMRTKVTSCVEHERHLYGFDESMLRCVDFDGNLAWTVRGLGLGSLSRAGDRLLVLTSDGELIVAAASPAGFEPLSRRKVLDGGVYWTAPVLVGGLIYVRNSHGDLVCLDHRPAAAPDTADSPTATAPVAADLFAAHAVTRNAAAIPADAALEIHGQWQVVLRGLPPSPMTWTLAEPDRWQLHLDAGGLSYGHHDDRTWAVEPQGTRLVEGDERLEFAALFPLRELVAPACPADATTRPRPERFAETRCWKVVAPDGDDATRSFWFAVDDGRLVGTGGTFRSTLVFVGEVDVDGVKFPTRITRFRADDGQEHVLEVDRAEWIPRAADTFALPAPVERLFRTPEQLAAAERQLRERFAGELGRYRDDGEPERVYVIRIERGDLWIVPEYEDGDTMRVVTERGEDGIYPLEGPPIRLTFAERVDGVCPGLTVIFGPGEGVMRWPATRIER